MVSRVKQASPAPFSGEERGAQGLTSWGHWLVRPGRTCQVHPSACRQALPTGTCVSTWPPGHRGGPGPEGLRGVSLVQGPPSSYRSEGGLPGLWEEEEGTVTEHVLGAQCCAEVRVHRRPPAGSSAPGPEAGVEAHSPTLPPWAVAAQTTLRCLASHLRSGGSPALPDSLPSDL